MLQKNPRFRAENFQSSLSLSDMFRSHQTPFAVVSPLGLRRSDPRAQFDTAYSCTAVPDLLISQGLLPHLSIYKSYHLI
jgi:hypothetical protein